MSPSAVDVVSRYADMLQVGTRSMANFDLLRALGSCGRPVLLKRGMSATVDEWLQAAEYIVAAGNSDVVLCERGFAASMWRPAIHWILPVRSWPNNGPIYR